MRVMLIIFTLVTLSNYVKADSTTSYKECVDEQVQLIEENEESYTAEEIATQKIEVPEYCKDLVSGKYKGLKLKK